MKGHTGAVMELKFSTDDRLVDPVLLLSLLVIYTT